MAKTETLLLDKFYGGIVRDEKSSTPSAALNVEELDIFNNANFIQPEQIMSSDTLPSNTEIYSFTADNSDNVWGYGKNTSNDQIRLIKVTSGGSDNPGSFSTTFTSGDSSDLAYKPSPVQYFRRDDGNQDFLYYLSNNSGTIKLRAYDITADSETEQDTGATNMTLTGLDGSFDRCFMKVIFGELFVGNGQFIAKVDKDGVFSEKAFTLPNGWEAVDLVAVSDVAIILARNVNTEINESKGFWWDLTATTQVDDSFDLPIGGPQWIYNHKETIKIMCAHNGIMRMFQLSGAFPGAVPVEIPGTFLDNIASASSEEPISSPRSVSTKDNLLYFGLNKTDKTGIYAIGQLDSDKPTALILSKRFLSTDYSNHTSWGLFIQGPNYYAAFDDNGTSKISRCETKNSPDRSSNAVYESIIIDSGEPAVNKTMEDVVVLTKPLAASTSIAVSLDTDYGGSFSSITRPDGTSMNATNDTLGYFKARKAGIRSFQVKLAFTSNGTDTPKLVAFNVQSL